MEAVAAQKNAAAPDTLALPVPCSAVPVEHADFIRQVLERIGDKWTLMVIISLRGGGVMRYKDLQSGIPGISQRMLSAPWPSSTRTAWSPGPLTPRYHRAWSTPSLPSVPA